MEAMPEANFGGKSKDRWNPVRRNVVYINLKAAFGSSIDIFTSKVVESMNRKKKEVMLREARRLKSIVTHDKKSYNWADTNDCSKTGLSLKAS